ncbi:Cytosolic sulfotransferase 17 [Raphanus sativus]|uniref:Sulfotransferase n=1 Tax=Raphanus sativus TaxID=3726 RepID=A0A6J0KAS9_RAPSA|nr:cytosolic sulfotransferase 18-like [Raphanus sativus]KAJ4873361.1 Cytosolic sulfotransferase 17 [Raphanus sativus]
MATETVTDTTGPNHDEAESTEFEKQLKRYQGLISTLPHVKGWRPKDPLIGYGGHWLIQPIVEGSLYAQEFFQAGPNDFLICSYPKTGTTWLKSLAFVIANRSRFDDSTNPLLKRNPHELIPFIEIEFPLFHQVEGLEDEGNTLFSTHMPYKLLPDSVVKTGCKMVYIWRDPKDTFISLWHFFQKKRSDSGPLISLEESFDMFCQGFSAYGPYLDHVLAYWKAHQENPDQILFLKYETLSADPLHHVKKLAEFMGYGFTTEEEKNGVVEKVVNLCSFETLKNLEANKGDKEREDYSSPFTNSAYFRKGKIGDWENYLTPDMAARMDRIMEEKVKGTDLLENGK